MPSVNIGVAISTGTIVILTENISFIAAIFFSYRNEHLDILTDRPSVVT
jgi:hypothetical protein